MEAESRDFGLRLLRTIKCVAKTDQGIKRNENQDSFGIVEKPYYRFYMVADGMGGARAGGRASDIAIATISNYLSRYSTLNRAVIEEAVKESNKEIFSQSMHDPRTRGMGTTICGVGFSEDGLLVCNVGDSRLYRLRHHKLSQMTEDHTLVAELINSGALKAEDAEKSGVSHILTRSLGPSETVHSDIRTIPGGFQEGDIFLLCSDGLYGLVDNKTIRQILSNPHIDEVADELVERANAEGGTDNITVLVIKVLGYDRTLYHTSGQGRGVPDSVGSRGVSGALVSELAHSTVQREENTEGGQFNFREYFSGKLGIAVTLGVLSIGFLVGLLVGEFSSNYEGETSSKVSNALERGQLNDDAMNGRYSESLPGIDGAFTLESIEKEIYDVSFVLSRWYRERDALKHGDRIAVRKRIVIASKKSEAVPESEKELQHYVRAQIVVNLKRLDLLLRKKQHLLDSVGLP